MNTQHMFFNLGACRQRGVVLLVGLLILLALSIIGMTSANMGVVNQKIVFNAQTNAEVFQAAEIASVYAKNKDAWVNDALAHLDQVDYSAWITYPVPIGYEHVEAESTVSAHKALLNGFTLNSDSSMSYVRLEVASDAKRGESNKKGLTQGWIRVGAS